MGIRGPIPGKTKLVQVRPPRLLKVCDVARMAREVCNNDSNVTPEMVVACIAKGFGFSHVAINKADGSNAPKNP